MLRAACCWCASAARRPSCSRAASAIRERMTLPRSRARLRKNWAAPLGEFEAVAANEPGRRVQACLYGMDVSGDIAPGQEIDEIVWVDPSAPPDIVLAPLTRDHVLPLACM